MFSGLPSLGRTSRYLTFIFKSFIIYYSLFTIHYSLWVADLPFCWVGFLKRIWLWTKVALLLSKPPQKRTLIKIPFFMTKSNRDNYFCQTKTDLTFPEGWNLLTRKRGASTFPLCYTPERTLHQLDHHLVRFFTVKVTSYFYKGWRGYVQLLYYTVSLTHV